MHIEEDWLSDHPNRDVQIICVDSRCAVAWRHDVDRLITSRGDRQLRGLRVTVCRAMGCPRVAAIGMRPCLSRIQIIAKRKTKAEVPTKAMKGQQHLRPVTDERITDLQQWDTLFAVCVCEHLYHVDKYKLTKQFGKNMHLSDLEPKLSCRACGNNVGNVLAIAKARR